MFCLILQLALLGIVAIVAEDTDGIIGGEHINIKEAPYQVAVLLSDYPHCGGTIVGDDIIITAAHCLAVSATPNDFTIRVGSSYTQEGGEIHQVKDFVAHPGWSFETEDYDVGIIWLAKKLSFSDAVQPIRMANVDDEIPDGEETIVTGWGQTIPGSNDQPILQRIRVLKMDQLECKKDYASMILITSRMICAGLDEGGEEFCQGDSGGPLIYNNTLYGIVSWNRGCALPGFPGVYAKVAALRTWINDSIYFLKKQSTMKEDSVF